MLYVFDDYLLDTDRCELRQGSSSVAIEPQAFDLLRYLIHHRERVVSRDELIESIWAGRLVSESALSTRINAVRSAIGDSGTQQRLIKTLPRRGVRFVGEVREELQPAEAALAGAPENLRLSRRPHRAARIRLAGGRADRHSCQLPAQEQVAPSGA